MGFNFLQLELIITSVWFLFLSYVSNSGVYSIDELQRFA